ncbi:MAG: Multiple RNA-binding domain-containing protein 1 [Caeruleum heppii]|nr:MAG: Multiple RNA-binding domain-containing protein 1 [Caeruleum heppii]
MTSSRIFVRGLPPTLTDDEFQKYFSSQQAITDAKLIPRRRIGYVGYRTTDEAAKAVQYFNKSFIRMSKIAVEIARPHPRAAEDASLHQGPEEVAENPLKRKRPSHEGVEKDAKLQEFLSVMQPSTKRKTWANEDFSAFNSSSVVEKKTESPGASAEYEDEYEEVPKKSEANMSRTKHTAHGRVDNPTRGSESGTEAQKTVDGTVVEPLDAEKREEARLDVHKPTTASTSDADWLRSRTSRLLGLVEDEDSPMHKSDAPDKGDTAGANGLSSIALGTNGNENKSRRNATPEVADQKQSATMNTTLESIMETGRLFIRNLPYSVSEDEILRPFTVFGEVQEVHLPLDPSGKPKGFAYVQFVKAAAAAEAYDALDGKTYQGRLLHILPAAAKRETKLDDFGISKLPLKKQQQLKRKASAASTTFNWNSMFMSADAVMSSISDRLGVPKSELLDPTSSDAAAKQAHAETHVIQETKAYFAAQGVDLEAFKHRERDDTAILVKNFPYGTTADELKRLFEEHGQIIRVLMPPAGTIAMVHFSQVPQARAAFSILAYRRFKDSILFLEKGPKGVFSGSLTTNADKESGLTVTKAKPSTTDLLAADTASEVIETTSLFVRNLNFVTTSDRLIDVFAPLDGFISARVKTKPDPKKPGQTLSMGFGFLEFRTKAQAQSALSAMNGYTLDGHQLLIRASHKGLDAAEERKREDDAKKAAGKKTKIIVKNLPFEATKKDIRSLFGAYGLLRSVRVPKKFDSSARGFAFADFVTSREAENAMKALRDTHLLGRRLVLEFAAEDATDAEEEIEKMQRKVGRQANQVALQKLTGAGRKKFNVQGAEEVD